MELSVDHRCSTWRGSRWESLLHSYNLVCSAAVWTKLH